ncbi:MAG: 4-hydroxybenzoate octaprenyltransferase [Desulfobacteraceae bacterium]|nr:MAG: 4-hydroxybenzoate octaprenyltransferase [Desulfobacteraceae bacterium]
MIKFSHTVFALPFAMAALVIAYENHPFSWLDLFWIILAMVGARSAAMGFNRIVDAEIDARNARTAIREIPSGKLSKKEAVLFVSGSSLLFFLSAAMLSKLCFYLSFPVMFFLLFYSYTKRFTQYCHIFLGFAISLAPAGAYVAVTDTLSLGIVCLSLALMTYIAGFDILYACQDIEFDQKEALFSLPSKLGAQKAMQISSVLHIITFACFLVMYLVLGLHPVFLIFLGVIGILLIVEHRLVRPDNLSHIHIAFFHINSVISVLLFAGILVQALV